MRSMSLRQVIFFNLVVTVLCFSVNTRVEAQASNSKKVISGTIEVLLADYPQNDRSDLTYQVRLPDNKTYRVMFTADASSKFKTGDRVEFEGDLATRSVLLVDPNKVKLIKPRGRIAADEGTNTRKVVVLLLDFKNSKEKCGKNVISEFMANNPNSVNGFYDYVSGGKVAIDSDVDLDGAPDVFGPFTLPFVASSYSCSATTWADSADKAAAAAGVDLSLYQHRVYVLPPNTGCTWAGLGNIGCETSCRVWVSGKYCGIPDVYAHELAHNLGEMHASTDLNNDGKIDVEYGDMSCPMGFSGIGWRHFNAPHAKELGWLSTDDEQLVTESGDYEIAPMELASSGIPRILRIPVPGDTANSYYISYRASGDDYSTGLRSLYANKLSIHKWGGQGNTLLLKNTDLNKPYSPAKGVEIKQLSGTNSSAVARVTLQCNAVNPTFLTDPTEFLATSPTTKFPVVLRARNNDTNCSTPTTFKLSYKPAPTVSVALEAVEVALEPGEETVVNATLSLIPSARDGRYYSYINISDFDGKDPSHASVARAVVVNLDRVAPTVATVVTGTVRLGFSITLNWRASTDLVSGVAKYEIYRDNALLASPATTSYVDKNVTVGETYSYTIRAVDRVGNRSAFTKPLSVPYKKK